jgi:hypothetical protein
VVDLCIQEEQRHHPDQAARHHAHHAADPLGAWRREVCRPGGGAPGNWRTRLREEVGGSESRRRVPTCAWHMHLAQQNMSHPSSTAPWPGWCTAQPLPPRPLERPPRPRARRRCGLLTLHRWQSLLRRGQAGCPCFRALGLLLRAGRGL